MAGPTRSKQASAIDAMVRESVASIDRMTPEILRSLAPVLADVRNELRTDVHDWLQKHEGSERFTPSQHAKALRSIEGALDKIKELEPAMSHTLASARRIVGPLAGKNLEREITRLGSIFGESMHVPQIHIAAIIAKGDKLLWKRHERSAARYAGGVGEDLRKQLAIGMAKGETFAQMSARIAGLAGGRQTPMNADAIADAMGMRWRHVGDRLVRTESMHAYNLDHSEALIDLNGRRPAGEDEWMQRVSAAADRGVCVICRDLDDTVAPLGGTFKGYPPPPFHPHCRCVLIAWLKRWGDMPGERPPREADEPAPPPPPDRARARPEPREAYVPPPEPPRPQTPPARSPISGVRFDAEVQERTPPSPTRQEAAATRREAKAAIKAARDAAVKAAPEPGPPKPPSKAAVKRAEIAARREAREMRKAMAPPKNAKRVAAARVAGEASAERAREIYNTARSNLPEHLHAAWDAEGREFMKEKANRDRIAGVKDAVNAASKISEAFAESYGSGDASVIANEGDRFARRAEIDAVHAEEWAETEEQKQWAEWKRQGIESGELDEDGNPTARGHAHANADRAEHVDVELDEWGDPVRSHSSQAHSHSPAVNHDDDPPF